MVLANVDSKVMESMVTNEGTTLNGLSMNSPVLLVFLTLTGLRQAGVIHQPAGVAIGNSNTGSGYYYSTNPDFIELVGRVGGINSDRTAENNYREDSPSYQARQDAIAAFEQSDQLQLRDLVVEKEQSKATEENIKRVEKRDGSNSLPGK